MKLRTCLPLILICLWSALQAATLRGRVVGVADGDTLTLLDAKKQAHKIRLSGIDAPEKAQPFGERAKLSLGELAFGQEASADCPRRDRYRREVCTVFIHGKDVGLEQIRIGMAYWYRDYAKDQSLLAIVRYAWAEFRARLKRRGLWADETPVPPWEWRRRARGD